DEDTDGGPAPIARAIRVNSRHEIGGPGCTQPSAARNKRPGPGHDNPLRSRATRSAPGSASRTTPRPRRAHSSSTAARAAATAGTRCDSSGQVVTIFLIIEPGADHHEPGAIMME